MSSTAAAGRTDGRTGQGQAFLAQMKLCRCEVHTILTRHLASRVFSEADGRTTQQWQPVPAQLHSAVAARPSSVTLGSGSPSQLSHTRQWQPVPAQLHSAVAARPSSVTLGDTLGGTVCTNVASHLARPPLARGILPPPATDPAASPATNSASRHQVENHQDAARILYMPIHTYVECVWGGAAGPHTCKEPVHDDVWVAPDRRREVCVLGDSQRIVAPHGLGTSWGENVGPGWASPWVQGGRAHKFRVGESTGPGWVSPWVQGGRAHEFRVGKHMNSGWAST
eukprot:361150-Chlamydomonas_euryale.AAC.2